MKLKNTTIQILGLSLFLSLVLTGCSDSKTNYTGNQELVTVQVATSVLPKNESYFSASGQIEAEQFANISTRMMGYVTKVHVKVGDKVKGHKEDNIVIKLDPTLLGDRKLYSFNDNEHYFFTSEHPFMTEEGWKSIKPEKTKERDGAHGFRGKGKSRGSPLRTPLSG